MTTRKLYSKEFKLDAISLGLTRALGLIRTPEQHQQPPHMPNRPAITAKQRDKKPEHQPLGPIQNITQNTKAGQCQGENSNHHQRLAIGKTRA